jgi:hypothetical protein
MRNSNIVFPGIIILVILILLVFLVLLILLVCILVGRIYQKFGYVIIFKASKKKSTLRDDMALLVVQSKQLELHTTRTLCNVQSNAACVHVTHRT